MLFAEHIKKILILGLVTSKMAFPGIPDMMDAAEDTPSPATHDLTAVVYFLDSLPDDSEVRIAVPEKVESNTGQTMLVSPVAIKNDENVDKYRVSTYWGSHKTIPEGQPRTIWSTESERIDLSDDPTRKARTVAYWQPMQKTGRTVYEGPKSAVGDYSVSTDKYGTIKTNIGKSEDFLPPLKLLSPTKKMELAKPVQIKWNKIDRAMAYYVVVQGGNTEQAIVWQTSEKSDIDLAYVKDTPLSSEEIGDMIESGELLGPDVTSVTVPAGAFEGSDSVMLNIEAIGSDKVAQVADTQVRVIVRSSLSAPIYIK